MSLARRCLLLCALLVATALGCSDGELQGNLEGGASRDAGIAERDLLARDSVADGPASNDGTLPVDWRRDVGPPDAGPLPEGGPRPDSTRDRGVQPSPDTTVDQGVQPSPDTTVDRGVQPSPDTTVDQGVQPSPDTTVDGGAPDTTIAYEGTFPAAQVGFSSATLRIAGVNRTMELYLPAQLPAGAPVMILFHGTDGVASDAMWGADATSLADSAKVIVVAPQARTMSSGDWDNHVAGQRYFETYPNTDPDTNADLLLVRAIIAEAARAYDADTRRVYSLGFSNGAFFAQFTAMMMPGRIAAFAENSGGLVRCATTSGCDFRGSGTSCADLASQAGYCSCTGTEKPGPTPTNGRKPPGYIVHASNDSTVSVYYSCALAARMQALGYPMQVTIRQSGGHAWQPNFATQAWSFLSQYQLP